MKKLAVYLFVAALAFSMAGNVGATLYVYPEGTETDVGSVDPFVYAGDVDSDPTAELAFVNNYLASQGITDLYTLAEYRKMDYKPIFYEVTDTTSTYTNAKAFQLLYDPDYFVLKTGVGASEYDHWLFKNLSELNWAVINWDDVNIDNIDAVSHWGEAGAPVPEPATMLLLGSGLIGLAGIGRKKIKKARSS